MKALHLDSTGGASGDMILAALLGSGLDKAALEAQIQCLPIGHITLKLDAVEDGALTGVRLTVQVAEAADPPHRRLKDIRAIIECSALPPAVKEDSIRVFERLADAEARVHGVTPDAVHFHEVGAADAIVDIVGACAARHALGIEAVTVGPLPLGQGITSAAHGVMPLPVPAVAELLRHHRVVRTDEPFELVTPTGAALITTWTEPCRTGTDVPHTGPEAGVLINVANAFGHRTLNKRPNLLRAFLLDMPMTPTPEPGSCLVLECNVDDTVPELLGHLTQQLMDQGALDVTLAPVYMKKQRPGTMITVLSQPQDRERFLDIIFAESTTFGIREYDVRRTVLERRTETVETPYGQVDVKIGTRHGHDITRTPEYDDCVRCAHKHGVSVRQVYEAAGRTLAEPALKPGEA